MPKFAIIDTTQSLGRPIMNSIIFQTTHDVRCFSGSPMDFVLPRGTSSFRGRTGVNRKTFYQGHVSNIGVLQSCLAGTDVIFLCAVSRWNVPNCTLAQDHARAVVTALNSLRSRQPDMQVPKLIVLGLARGEPKFAKKLPWFVNRLLFYSKSHVLRDLVAAETFLRAQSSWLTAVFIKSGEVVWEGYTSGYTLSETNYQFWISTHNLVHALIEAGETLIQEGTLGGETFGVLARENYRLDLLVQAVFTLWLPELFAGLMLHLFPWLYPIFVKVTQILSWVCSL